MVGDWFNEIYLLLLWSWITICCWWFLFIFSVEKSYLHSNGCYRLYLQILRTRITRSGWRIVRGGQSCQTFLHCETYGQICLQILWPWIRFGSRRDLHQESWEEARIHVISPKAEWGQISLQDPLFDVVRHLVIATKNPSAGQVQSYFKMGFSVPTQWSRRWKVNGSVENTLMVVAGCCLAPPRAWNIWPSHETFLSVLQPARGW